jgi:hypothetical protein
MWNSCSRYVVFFVVFCRSLFVLLSFFIVLSVLHRLRLWIVPLVSSNISILISNHTIM